MGGEPVAFGLVFPQDIWALVPHPDRDAVLVTESDAEPTLPTGTADRDDDTAVRLTAVTKPWGIDAPFLRRVAAVEHDGRELLLKEFESVPAAGRRWLGLDDLDRLRLPGELRPALSRWAEYQRGREYPEFRPAWSRPGWFARSRDWLGARLARIGIEPAGQPEVVQQWAISAVLRQPTHGHGDYYLKSVFGGPGRGFWHEPALSAGLAERHPGDVPAVTTIDADHGLMLMPDMGVTVIDDHPADTWDEGLRVLARIQRAWVGRRDEVLGLGCPDRDLAVTVDQLELALHDPLVTSEVDESHLSRVRTLLPTWRSLFAEAAQWPVPLTLVHGDYHPGNAGLRPDGGACAFDWSDGAWSQPLLDVATYLHRAGDAKDRLWDVYLDHWSDYAPLSELRQLIPAVTVLRMLYSTVTYHGIMVNVDPDDRFVFAKWANDHWRMALQAWDAMV